MTLRSPPRPIRALLLLTSLAVTGAAAGTARSARAATLAIRVEGVVDGKGVLGACLWNKAAGFPYCGRYAPLAKTSGRAVNGGELRFDNLPPGIYAVSVIQDLYNDNKLHTNVIGIPTEPVGLSNNPQLIALPRPGWNDARFAVSGDTKITVRLTDFH